MKVELYKIETLSNLHVGSGDINFGVVDNQVQRDAITGLPSINSSSLKGAFREFFENMDDTKNLVEYIFGPSNGDNNNHQTGAYSFFEASLLTRPVRSNKKLYFNATTPDVIKNLLDTIDNLNIDIDEETKKALQDFSNLNVQNSKPLIFEDIKGVILEDYEASYQNFDTSKIEEFLGQDLALFSYEDFKTLELPVLARNQLENGESKNLWYEEIVPKKSTFYFSIAKPTNLDEKDKEQKINGFENRFNNEGSRVQFGANKSIGYGYSKVTKVSKWAKKE